MPEEGKTGLARLGWDEGFGRSLDAGFGAEPAPGRVLSVSRGCYLVGTESGVLSARLRGATYRPAAEAQAGVAGCRRATRARDLPVTGDWVALGHGGPPCPTGSSGQAPAKPYAPSRPAAPLEIVGVLPRRNLISRKRAGRETIEQPLAANIDLACILFSLEGGRLASARTAERYLALIATSRVETIIILNKADIALDRERSIAEIAAAAPGVELRCASCVDGEGIDELRARLAAGTTTLLLGPSGVGKSTLVNALARGRRGEHADDDDPAALSGPGGRPRAVGGLRRDLKGRHTTSARELLLLPGGALVIDTPGLREIGPWGDGSELDAAFPEMELLARSCRFRDCGHSQEPGCAVQAAVASGEIPPDRLAAYLELRGELVELAGRAAERSRREERRGERRRGGGGRRR